MAHIVIPVRMVGPDNEELSLGEFAAIRRPYLERLLKVAEVARKILPSYDALQKNPERAAASSVTFHQEITSLRESVAALQEVEGHMKALGEG